MHTLGALPQMVTRSGPRHGGLSTPKDIDTCKYIEEEGDSP